MSVFASPALWIEESDLKQTPSPCRRRAGGILLAGLSLLLAAALPLNSRAQPETSPSQAAAEQPATAADKRRPKEQEKQEEQTADSTNAERFTPTEQISEDLSVSFPVDI